MMSRAVVFGAVAVAFVTLQPPMSRAADKDRVRPHAFEMFCVNGTHAGTYYCPVCDFGTHPFALVFVRGPSKADPELLKFLKALDELVAKHPDAGFGVAAVFIGDGAYRQAILNTEDQTGQELDRAEAQRNALVEKVRDLARSSALNHLQVGLTATDARGLPGYHIPADAQVSVFAFASLNEVGQPAIFAKAPTKSELNRLLRTITDAVLKAEKANRADD